ncbi:hypothetical protein [Cupriavidus pinatubonensis]|uniref:hypothetical protein n=1 Tax=Cupriavidus pinatubonensis TaxID=248026 RepID=UPI001FD48E19|nr:hypothetical protein [Cupriavidus pinatubonensis]
MSKATVVTTEAVLIGDLPTRQNSYRAFRAQIIASDKVHLSVEKAWEKTSHEIDPWGLPGLLEKFRKEALGAVLLAVYGVWQAEGKVRHPISSKLGDRTELVGALPTTSREFC